MGFIVGMDVIGENVGKETIGDSVGAGTGELVDGARLGLLEGCPVVGALVVGETDGRFVGDPVYGRATQASEKSGRARVFF